MPLAIRQAKADDALNLAALAIQVWLHTYATTGIRKVLAEYVLSEYTQAHFLERTADPAHLLLVAEADNHLVGYADLAFASPCATAPDLRTELATLYIQEHFTGRGIGGRFLEACASEARRRCGDPGFWLSVYHLNARAIAFYRKHGFEAHGSFFFEFGGERHENFILIPTSGSSLENSI